MTKKTESPGKPVDGRVQRSLNSRQKIMDAVLGFCNDGVLIPTAQEVADRAGVGLRTVFRHFSDMQSLFIEMNSQIIAHVTPLFADLDRSGPLESRIARLVSLHCQVFDEIGNYMRASLAQAWKFEALHKNYKRGNDALRADMKLWLPELESLDDSVALEIELLLSFESWDRMRRFNGLSRDEFEALLRDRIAHALKS